jgi:medium-chain acyl-[acyl-carrier-protein] hydrolase
MAPHSGALRVSSQRSYSRWISGNPLELSSKTRLRLFCFPYAGGGASIFRAWSAKLPPTVEVCPIQLPGREHRWREAPFTRLLPLVEILAQDLQPLLHLPFAFFGHSMGALISFELAQQLCRKHGKTPVHLFVSGARAPHLPDLDPPIHHLPDAVFVEALRRRYNGIPEEVLRNAELMQIVLPALRADVEMCETYVPTTGAPLTSPISAYGGQYDTQIGYDGVVGWYVQTWGAFTFRFFPGGHFFLTSAQAALLRVISSELSRIAWETTPPTAQSLRLLRPSPWMLSAQKALVSPHLLSRPR